MFFGFIFGFVFYLIALYFMGSVPRALALTLFLLICLALVSDWCSEDPIESPPTMSTPNEDCSCPVE